MELKELRTNKQELISKYELIKNSYNFDTVATDGIISDLKRLDEPQPVKVPQFVADWIEKCKTFEHFAVSLSFALQPIVWEKNNLSGKCIDWLMDASNQDTFARAWLDGYEVEEEKRYLVKMKGMSEENTYLTFRFGHTWMLSNFEECEEFRLHHTLKELENANFGWVFDCPGIEIEEVE